MKLRTILYGYEVKNGKICIFQDEAIVVSDIYADYISGQSLKTIADTLTEKGVTYYLDKSVWTKNAIARIIENPKYTGADGYPAIISSANFELANKRKNIMGGTQSELSETTALIKSKMVCSHCGQKMGRRNKWKTREKWLCPSGCKVDIYLDDKEIFTALLDILNRVRRTPEILTNNDTTIGYSPSMEVIRENKEIERLKEQRGVELEVISKMVLQCVAHKYECCLFDKSSAMTNALIDRYCNLPPINEVDITLIRETVKRISVNSDGTLTITFINNSEVRN